jgi:hypothetical protein
LRSLALFCLSALAGLLLAGCAHHAHPAGRPIAITTVVGGTLAPPTQVTAYAFRWTPTTTGRDGPRPAHVQVLHEESFVMVVIPPVEASVDLSTGLLTLERLPLHEDFTGLAPQLGYRVRRASRRDLDTLPSLLILELVNRTVCPPRTEFKLVLPDGTTPAIDRFITAATRGETI